MRAEAPRQAWQTEGERHAALAYVVLALIGAGLAFVTVIRVRDGAWLSRPVDAYDLWLVLCGAAGACGALRLGQSRFGQPGLAGLGQAVIGMMAVSLAAPVIAGTLALPLYGTMFGPLALATTFAGAPFVALLWLATLCGVHLLMATYRAERDSIFAPRGR